MRELTQNEIKVLAHVVMDPITWWTHCQTSPNIIDPELALAGKIVRHYSKYYIAKKTLGDDYKNRIEREPNGKS